MNKYIKYNLITFIFVAFLLPSNVVAAIASLKGDVKIREDEIKKYNSAYKGQMIQSGNWIKTGDGVFLSVIFLDGTNVKIHQKTEIEIKSSRLTAKELKTNMYIAEGEAWSTVSKQGGGDFKIETPTAVASVKGTEFDVTYDFNNSLTTLKVISGQVEFGNDDIGSILASAMEGSSIDKDTSEPKKYKITQDDLPKWQASTSSSLGFNIIPNKDGKIPINTSLRINLQAKNIVDDSFVSDFNNLVSIETTNDFILLSKTGDTWSNRIDVNMNSGKTIFYAKSIKEGLGSIIVTSKNTESKKAVIEFYETKSQRVNSQNKIFQLAKSKGYESVVDAIENMNLESSKIVLGNANIDDIIQKIESNEYEIVKFNFKKQNGKVIVNLEIKPANN